MGCPNSILDQILTYAWEQNYGCKYRASTVCFHISKIIKDQSFIIVIV
uniref:Uncharacterized protein n=1 Tax=Arundo donax TaxID=35708 RepID=A0A0A9CDJ3_ARUDO